MTISGRILDRNGTALPGMVVMIRNAEGITGRELVGLNARYQFSTDAGCFTMRFFRGPGGNPSADTDPAPFCLEPGESVTIDGVHEPTGSAPPADCARAALGDGIARVEIQENGGDWATSYRFYDRGGRFQGATTGVTPTDLTESIRQWDIEAPLQPRFYSLVTAVRGGAQSRLVPC
ncbi:MAG: hypothetical protein AAF547_09850 [Actinomycetota bacterium]